MWVLSVIWIWLSVTAAEEDINNLCDNHPCENGGSCFQYDSSYYCHCISPFVGEHCDMELGLNDEGRLLIHQPTGTYSVCLLDWDDNDASVACRFLNKPGKGVAYTLPHLEDFKRKSYLLNCEGHEDSIDLCQGQSGDHIDIRCEDQGDAALECIEEDINDLCDNHPCENGGSCFQYDSSYYCHCISPFVGEHCDMELSLNDEGRLLIHQPTGTYSVCLLDWDDNDASVACRCLNKPGKGVAYTLPHLEDFKRQSYLLNCEGHEDSIDLCQGQSGDHIDIRCEDQGDAALECIEEDINDLCDNHPCENGGSCFQYDSSYYCHCISPFVGEHCDMELSLNDEGRLLIHQPTGTYSVCLLDWDDNDASVACRFLNKPGKGVAYTLPHLEDFKRQSYLLNCEGHEDSIDLCQGQSGDHIEIRCEDQGDAALECIEEDINDLCDNHPCENGGSCFQYDSSYYCHCISPFVGEHCDVELSLNDEGRLLILQPTGTYSVCLLDWDDNDASVACRFLNKPGKGVAYTLPHLEDFKRQSYLLNCVGHEDSIDLCQGQSGDHIDIRCEDQGDAALECIEEDINDLCDNHTCENGGSCYQYDASYYCHCISPFVGEHCDMELGLNDEGRLLIHQPTGTYSVCLLDWDDNDASVACRCLNKPGKGVAYTLPHLEDFKRQSYLLNCVGHEDSIDLCQGQSGDHIDIRCEDQGDAALECIEEEMLADYLGCYKDDTNRILDNLHNHQLMNIKMCQGICEGYAYFGLQFHFECYCGNSLGDPDVYEKRPEEECNITCAGNERQICGGEWRISVYQGHSEDVTDLCLNNPCGNGGTCHQYDGAYYCDCISPFVGEHCDMELGLNDEGRLLIHYPTGTYSLCLLDWDDNDASVACRFLNKPGKGVAYTLPHLEDLKRLSYLLNCEGHEDSIDLCQGQSGDHIDISCEDQGDAALKCIEEDMTDLCDNHPCENGGSCLQYDSSYYCHCVSPFVGEHCDMELSLNDEGRLLIHQPTGTYSVCLLDWDDNDASVACRFLNKPGKGVAYMLPHSEDFKRQSYLLNCEGHEDSIDLCQGQSGDHIDIRCENQGDAALECIEEEMLAEYLGCYKDDTNRILDNLHIHELMNIEMCQGICEGYTYFGLQFHFECYCGNSLGDPDVYEKRPEEECTITCAGNERQICGGEWRISVYQGHSEYVTDLCLNNPCGNGGTCHQYDGAYYCDCFSPFIGGHCEIRLDLSDDGRLLIHQPTGTYSLCLLDWDDSDASVACRFLNKPGKGVAYKLPHSVDFYRLSYSLLCEGDEKSINQCSGESGEHIDMACQAEDDAALKCIEECNPDTEVRCNSLGPGKCISKDWICDGWEDCETGWDEFECEDVNDLCLNNPCGNDGTCHQYDGSSYCECFSPYVGGHCEMRLDLSDDGRLLIHQPTGTYSLCLLDWDDNDASVACRFLNKPGKGVAHKLSHSIDFYRLSYSLLCEGDEKSINQCSGESGEHIDIACQAEDDAALKCIEECNPDTEVRCNSPGPGKCISKDWVCDGWEDCETGWDEFECACNMDYHARCDASDDGMCLNKTWICDGISDCQSGWDEDNCGCDFNTHVRCNDNNHGKCILKEWICDGLQDCATAWDETYCDSDTNQCSPDAFDCGDGKCIVKDRRCDEIADCANMKDEMDCPCDLKTHSRCDDDDNGKCISNSYICDRTVDCITGWDEEKCDCKNNPFKFQCNDGTCLSIAKRCDVYIDCGMDAEDEQDCPCSSPTHFQCLTGTCIPANRLCDRIRDCPDEEDELFCDRPIKEECKPGYAACGEDRCILEEFMCDGYYDCLTHTDEAKERCYPEKGWPKPDQGQGPGGSNEVDKVNSGPTNDGSSDRDHEPGSSANKWSIDDLSSYFNEAPLSTNTSFACLLMCLLLAIISTKP